MKPLGPIPAGYDTLDGELSIGGWTASALVAEAGCTPLFVYSRAHLDRRVAELRAAFDGAPWVDRVEWRSYTVTPEGPRSVEKDPVPWDGEKFDFLFLDGPRSAHAPNFGRTGTFRFATQHAAPGALIVWHDAQRPHEREIARKYFGHCARHRRGSVGWCRWEAPESVGGIQRLLRGLNPLA